MGIHEYHQPRHRSGDPGDLRYAASSKLIGYFLYKAQLIAAVMTSATINAYQIPVMPINFDNSHIAGINSPNCLSILIRRLNFTLFVDYINEATIVAIAANT